MSDDLRNGLWLLSSAPYRYSRGGSGCGCLGLFLQLLIFGMVIQSGLWIPIVVIGLIAAWFAGQAARRGE